MQRVLKTPEGTGAPKMGESGVTTIILMLSLIILTSEYFFEAFSEQIDSQPCISAVSSYNGKACEIHWNCTVQRLLSPWLLQNRSINRATLHKLNVSRIGHTPLLLKVSKGKLYCVRQPGLRGIKENLRIKAYRASHYINRLNRILKSDFNAIPDKTEWWTHQADLVKIPLEHDSIPFPVFSYGGAENYADIAGIPAAALSDKMGIRELRYLNEIPETPWNKRLNVAFFRGSLSDCGVARETLGTNINNCVRAKVILEADRSKHPLLKDIGASSSFQSAGINITCSRCEKGKLTSPEFVKNIRSHKYLLNIPGVGQSRRMAQLLRSGGVIFQAENKGYQFYDINLKPGVHYIPFDPERGVPGVGNLVSRLEWAIRNDKEVQNMAERVKSYAENCLTEQSVDYFAAAILEEYSNLLTGVAPKLPLVDLSECVVKRSSQSISRLCGIVQKCWS